MGVLRAHPSSKPELKPGLQSRRQGKLTRGPLGNQDQNLICINGALLESDKEASADPARREQIVEG